MRNNIVSFDDTETAFISKSDADLNRAYLLFKIISYSWLVRIAPPLVDLSLKMRLPIRGLIRKTVFRHFCGGETIDDCQDTINSLAKYHIGTILDYSVEGKETEEDFDDALEHTLAAIRRAKGDPSIPFSVFKPSGFAHVALLEKINRKEQLNESESEEFIRFKNRIQKICSTASENQVPVFIDAEETWIQDVVDELACEMMSTFNREKVIVYNTLQMYRTDRYDFLKSSIENARRNSYKVGFKIVRGAYMEKERDRALKSGYPSPIQPDKNATDKSFDAAIQYSIENLDIVSICCGTHNEQSCLNLTDWMHARQLPNNHAHIYFSQLYGMSDHISYNLAKKGYNVSKYVPYGPVNDVLPYLVRRAQENTSAAGQTGRELALIKMEKKRREI